MDRRARALTTYCSHRNLLHLTRCAVAVTVIEAVFSAFAYKVLK